MLSRLKVWFENLFKKKQEYKLIDTFGCTERPSVSCPTFLERKVHTQFLNAVQSYNIIVVYGESRQGKTWTIERYCPNQLRIGCNAAMDIDALKKEMLHVVGVEVRQIEHSITDEFSDSDVEQVSSSIGAEMVASAGMSTTSSIAHKGTLKTSYQTVNINNMLEFLEVLKSRSAEKYFVFDNFHYLSPDVQQSFCSLLKEFNYQGIKIIIVGVWKDASRITAMAPDLINRCAHIDIGTWTAEELQKVEKLGENALNIKIDEDAIQLFIECSAHNIGIFKDFLQRYCQKFCVDKTEQHKRMLSDANSATETADEVIAESYTPLRDRAINLALPQRQRKDSKHMRQKIVIALFTLIYESDADKTQSGFSINDIKKEVDKISAQVGEESVGISNLAQELGIIHTREENRQTGKNFISLFYYDKANKRLLVLEPTIYEIKSYKPELIEDIAMELMDELLKINKEKLEAQAE